MWRPLTANLFLFVKTQGLDEPLFIAQSDDCLKSNFHILPCGMSDTPGFRLGSEAGKSPISASVDDFSVGGFSVGWIRRARSWRTSHGQFVGRVARQLIRPRWFAGILHRRRHL